MASWSKHLRQLHSSTDKDLNDLDRESTPQREYHNWHHEEYQEHLDHTHDENGQLLDKATGLFNDRRQL